MTGAKKARKAIANITTMALLSSSLCITGCAQITDNFAAVEKAISGTEPAPFEEFSSEKQSTGCYIVDETGLLSTQTKKALEAQAAELAETYGVAPYLFMTNNTGNPALISFAQSYWNENGLGLGEGGDGILLVIDVGFCSCAAITHGKGTALFTDYSIHKLEVSAGLCLVGDDWEDAAEDYLESCKEALEYETSHGEPLDSDNDPYKVKVKVTKR